MKKDNIAYANSIVPTKRQMDFMDTEFCSLIYYGMNTFTNAEWGNGNEDPEIFEPTAVDTRQWAKLTKLSGMKGLILTCKHYDGFCLWPSAYTDHSVKYSKWEDGAGDVVKQCADSCREAGIKFGIYFPLWDRHDARYGTGEAYDKFVMNQLTELLTHYGDLFCVWLDNECDSSKGFHEQNYNYTAYFDLIRRLQPNAAICYCGPDIRWVGNRMCVCRSSEWSVVPYWYSVEAVEQAKGKKDVTKIPRRVNPAALDLGSRKAIKGCNNLVFYPAVVDITLRKKCFFHPDEEYALKPLSKIVDGYYGSVGANASFVVGLAPGPDGKIASKDVETMLSVGAQLEIDFNENLAEDSVIKDSQHSDNAHTGQMALSHDPEEYWHSGSNPDGAELILDLGDEYDIDKIVLKEHIATGQQVEAFSVHLLCGEKWKKVDEGTVIGHKRICRFKEQRVRYIKVVIEKAREFATIESFEAY